MTDEFKSQLKIKILEYLTSLESTVTNTVDFAKEQLPLIVQEYISYCRCSYTLTLLFCSFCLTAILVYNYKLISSIIKGTFYIDSDFKVGFLVISSVLSMILSIFFGIKVHDNTDKTIKAWIAPRVLIIDYVREEVSDKNKTNK